MATGVNAVTTAKNAANSAVRCGYRLRVTGSLDSSFELFLARADVHIEERCSRLRDGRHFSEC